MTVPVEVDPDAAREAAARELADPAYQAAEPSLLDRVFTWAGTWLVDVLSALGGGSGTLGLLVLVVLGVSVYAVVRVRAGKVARTHKATRTVYSTSRPRDPEDYRRAAEDARAKGDLTAAVRERFRAVVRELEVRGVLEEQSGRTVDECATQAGQRLPDRAGELRAAAALFDDVVYGGHAATEAAYRDLTALDTGLRTVAAR